MLASERSGAGIGAPAPGADAGVAVVGGTDAGVVVRGRSGRSGVQPGSGEQVLGQQAAHAERQDGSENPEDEVGRDAGRTFL